MLVTDAGWEEGMALPDGVDPEEVRSRPATMAAMLHIGFATWAAPHKDAEDPKHRKAYHAHIFPSVFSELWPFRIMRGVAREMVWHDKATAVGIAVGGLDLSGGEGLSQPDRLATAKMVMQGIQAGTIDATRDLEAVAYLTATDRKGACIVAATLGLDDDDRMVVTRWHGEDFGSEIKPPLKLDVWASVEELEGEHGEDN